MRLRSDIRRVVDSVRIVDTHEHLLPGPFTLRGLLQNSYAWWAVPGSGVTSAATYPSSFDDLPDDEWWERALPGLRSVSNTSFWRHLLVAFQDLYEFSEWTLAEDNIGPLSERVSRAHQDPDWYDSVISHRAGVQLALHDKYWAVGDLSEPKHYLKPVVRLDPFLFGYNRNARDHDNKSPYDYAEAIGHDVDTFDDYLALIDEFLLRSLRAPRDLKAGTGDKGGAAALKIATAYDRSLAFGRASRKEAEEAFNRLRGDSVCRKGAPASPEGRPAEPAEPSAVAQFQDFVLRYAVGRAVEHNLPIQVHTGLGKLQGSNPVHLCSLLDDFPEGKFVLLHGGYPWTAEAAAMALSYENVWLDLCWLPVISPAAARRALLEWLEVMSPHRILWGGDTWSPEGLYGAVQLAKETITDVLCRKVSEGSLPLSQAVEIPGLILRDNALSLFGGIETS